MAKHAVTQRTNCVGDANATVALNEVLETK